MEAHQFSMVYNMHVVKLVNTADLKSAAAKLVGSSPTMHTNLKSHTGVMGFSHFYGTMTEWFKVFPC